MRGIAGFFTFSAASVKPLVLVRMIGGQIHHGPDDWAQRLFSFTRPVNSVGFKRRAAAFATA